MTVEEDHYVVDIPSTKKTENPERPLGPPGKLCGYEFYHKVLNSSRLIVAPMVDHSEIMWRILSRRYGAELCYTPMIHSGILGSQLQHQASSQTKTISSYRSEVFLSKEIDRPLVAQFCGNTPETLLQAAAYVTSFHGVDAVDLNLGCPQGIARRGRYGAFLMEDWPLIEQLVATLDRNLDVPVTVKIRAYECAEKTIAYAQMLERAGAQLITVHGRLREQKGGQTGTADWQIIRRIKESVSVPVFANGNILYYQDIDRCLQATGCDGVMTAEANLYNPALFVPSMKNKYTGWRKFIQTPEFLELLDPKTYPLLLEHPPVHAVLLEYLAIVKSLLADGSLEEGSSVRCSTNGHAFKVLRRPLDHFPEFRPLLGQQGKNLQATESIVLELARKIEADVLARTHVNDKVAGWYLLKEAHVTPTTLSGVEVLNGYRHLPYWVSQPYIRPPADVKPDTQVEDKQRAKVGASQSATGEAPQSAAVEDEQNVTAATEHSIISAEEHKAHRTIRESNAEKRARKRKQRQENRTEVKELKHPKTYPTCSQCGNVGSSECSYTMCQRCCRERFAAKILEVQEKGEAVTLASIGNSDCQHKAHHCRWSKLNAMRSALESVGE